MEKQNLALEKRLKKYPQLQQRFESLLDLVEDAEGDLDKANAAEERLIQEFQQMGKEMLGYWAKEKEVQKTEEYLATNNKDDDKIKNKGKKKYIGTQYTEK